MSSKKLTAALALLIILFAASCASAPEEVGDGAEEAPAEDVTAGEEEAMEEETITGDQPEATGSEEDRGPQPPLPDAGEKISSSRGQNNTAVNETGETAVTDGTTSDRTAADTGETAADNNQLTAGEVDDNANWDEYLRYLRDYTGAQVIEVDVSVRRQIAVVDNQQRPVLGARIDILVGDEIVQTLRTPSNGRVYFFPQTLPTTAESYQVQITVNETTEAITIPAGSSQRDWIVMHPGAAQLPNVQLDILFLLDATGSMADEINQLKDNIVQISAQIDALPAQPDVRFGLVAYRDREDAYVTQVVDFVPDINAFSAELEEITAAGGGDYPEDLNAALSEAIHAPEWRIDNTVSLVFLVADAPPHLDYNQENHYAVEMFAAAKRGIKIYPIASSGLDRQGEYIFRQMAQVTGGRFIFLTYAPEGSGTSGVETDFNVSDYTVSALDDLVVEIVAEELSYLER